MSLLRAFTVVVMVAIGVILLTGLGLIICTLSFGSYDFRFADCFTFGATVNEAEAIQRTVDLRRRKIDEAEAEIRVLMVKLENAKRKP